MSPNNRTYVIQAILFILTIITTTLAGAEWMHGGFLFQFVYDFFAFIGGASDIPEGARVPEGMGWAEFMNGFQFSLPFLAILTVHEFGHYFVARAHQVKVTLPYYIPLWFGITQSIGTMGAFIRIKSMVKSRLIFFDIGVAGPLAGFLAALVVLWYGFTHLPPPEHIFTIHPEYAKYGLDYAQHVYNDSTGAVTLGDNMLFWFFKHYVADPSRLPHDFEIIHYPFLFAGYLALFFTSLNLIPIGQLDGGHVLYGLIGKERFNKLAPILFGIFAFYAGLGLFQLKSFATGHDSEAFAQEMLYLFLYLYFLFICFRRVTDNASLALIISLSIVVGQFAVSSLKPDWSGYPGFLAFVFILGRFLGIKHPETEENEPLDTPRIILGVCALIIFIISFSPKPFIGL